MYFNTAHYGELTSTEDGCVASIWFYNSEDELIGAEIEGVELFYSRKLSEDWGTDNTVLRLEEVGLETDTLTYKIGDGATPWNELPYVSDSANYTYNTEEDWPSDFVLATGKIGVEIGVEPVTYKFKIGDGATEWGDLNYAESEPAWVRVSAMGVAPEGTSYAIARARWTPETEYDSIIFDQALFERKAYVNSFFDGTSGQEDVQGLIWEGDPNASRSLFYRNYSVANWRLREQIVNYLTHGSTFALVYEAEETFLDG